MQLIVFVLSRVVKAILALGAIMGVILISTLVLQVLVPRIQHALADRDRLHEVTAERRALEKKLADLKGATQEDLSARVDSGLAAVEAEIAETTTAVAEQKEELERIREENDVCGWGKEAAAWALPGNFCDEAEEKIAAAESALETVESNFESAQAEAAILRDPELSDAEKLDQIGADGNGSILDREVENTQADLDQKKAEEASLKSSQDSVEGRVLSTWDYLWPGVFWVAALLLALPFLTRLANYFVLMPLLARAPKPINLAEGLDGSNAVIHSERAERTLKVSLASGESLAVRSEYVRPVGAKVTTLFLYDMSAPFISFASGLRGLSRVTGTDSGTSATLTAPADPDVYLMRIDFRDHPGVVMHPKHVVGIMGTPDLTSRWRWSLQAFATGQVRYILFAGTGSLIVQGRGDVDAVNPGGGTALMDQNLVMGFDSRLAKSVGRTEVFWQYVIGKTPLVLDEFSGDHPYFWQKATADGARNPIARTFDAFFSAIGKVLGF